MHFDKLKGNGNTKNVKNFVLMLSMLGIFSSTNYSLAMQDNDDDLGNYDVSQLETRKDDYGDENLDKMANYDVDEDENEDNDKMPPDFEKYPNSKKELKKPAIAPRKAFQLPKKNVNITLDDFMNEVRDYSKGMFSNGKLLNWLIRNKEVEFNKDNKNVDISLFNQPCTYFKLMENDKKINVAIGIDENNYIHFYAYSVRPVHVKSALSKLIVHETVLKKYLSLLSSVCNTKNDVQELLLDLILSAADRLPEVRMSPDSKSWDTELCIEFLKAVCPDSYTTSEVKMLRSANYEAPIEQSVEKNVRQIRDIKRNSKIKRETSRNKKSFIPNIVNKQDKMDGNRKTKLNFSGKNYLDKTIPLNIKKTALSDTKKDEKEFDDGFKPEIKKQNIVKAKYNKPKFKVEQVNNNNSIYEVPEEQIDYDDLADENENEEILEEDIDSNDDGDYTE